ncbi:hypothetical protein ACXXDK_07475 [Deinococcus sp. PESE-38]
MTGGKKQGGRPSGNKPGGTKPRQKIRITRETGQRRGGESGEDVTAAPAAGGYFDVRPAQLPHWLDSLSALTKPGVRGFPEVDAAQVVLAQTMRKDRVRGEVLDLTAQGGLLASLPGVTLRAVEGAAAALTVLRAAGLDAHAATPGEDLSGHWPERARTVALVLAGDRGNAYAQAQVAWAHACTPPAERFIWPETATKVLTATCGRRARLSGVAKSSRGTAECASPNWCAAPAPRRRCLSRRRMRRSASKWSASPACSAPPSPTRRRPFC